MAGVSVVVKAVLLWRRAKRIDGRCAKMANSNQAAAKFKIEVIRRRPSACESAVTIERKFSHRIKLIWVVQSPLQK
jgi:hypothetical protein